MKILFVSLSNIGDAVLSVPALDRLFERYPKAQIDVVAGPRAKTVFEKDARIRELIVAEKGTIGARWNFFKKLRARRYDVVVDLRRSYFSLLAPRRARTAAGGKSHKREEHLSALRSLGIRINPEPRELSFDARDAQKAEEEVRRLRSSGPLILIAPGSRSDLKRWPAERFALLAERLMGLRSARVAWIGDESERELAESIQALAPSASLNLAGRLTWHETVALIARADLLITNDSAPLHAADQMSRKVLCFFGPTDPRKYGPQRSNGILFRGLFCSPCGKAQCRYGHECMNDLSVDEAFKRAEALLDDAVERAGMRILVARLDRIGDVLVSAGAFASLRKKYPNARITALVRPAARAIPERTVEVDETLVYDYSKKGRHRTLLGYFRLVRELRRKKFDAAFILHPTLRTHLLCFLAGIPLRVGWDAEASFLLSHRAPDRRAEGHQHESQNAADVLRAFGVEPVFVPPVFVVYPEDKRAAARLLAAAGLREGERYAVFHAGSSSRSKEWPAAHFASLGASLRSREGLRVVLVGAPESAPVNHQLAGLLGSAAVDLTGKTDLPALAALFQGAAIVVSNDSGPAHLAAAVGAPLVTIFGRKKPGLGPERWRPLGSLSRALQKDAGCAICLADDCPIGFECLRQLKPDEVLNEALALMYLPRSPRTAAAHA